MLDMQLAAYASSRRDYDALLKLQATGKRFVAMAVFKRAIESAVFVQRHWRGTLARQELRQKLTGTAAEASQQRSSRRSSGEGPDMAT